MIMTEYRGISSGKIITTKNNMNNVMVGNKIKVDEDNGKITIAGIVKDVRHFVYKWRDCRDLERITHNIIIDIDDK